MRVVLHPSHWNNLSERINLTATTDVPYLVTIGDVPPSVTSPKQSFVRPRRTIGNALHAGTKEQSTVTPGNKIDSWKTPEYVRGSGHCL